MYLSEVGKQRDQEVEARNKKTEQSLFLGSRLPTKEEDELEAKKTKKELE